ncbi:hypothetical protein C6499_14795 [Candidatus Poribacteria bacterium]|nr:MAG: hypothetical protein C6499_14795 [Candidatus Poribacteria bacterium]
MKLTVYLLMVLMLAGCASKQLQETDIPSWDSQVPLESEDAKAPSLSKRLSNLLSEGGAYHFRKVKWGYSKERVELAEAGNTVFERSENAIVYKCKLNGVYCKLIYTFKNNMLRTAGYLSTTPIPNADNLIKEAVDKHGMPTTHKTYLDGLEEMIWKTPEMVIFCNLSPTVTKITPTKYKYSGRGLLKDIVKNELPKQQPGGITYWDGVYAHVDPAFFNQLHEVNFPLSELSFYEKQLLGVLLKSRRTIIPGVGTIPQ